jgi:hypothetical protein
MPVKWRPGFDAAVLCDEITRMRKTEGGRPHLAGWHLRDVWTVLDGAFSFHPDISRRERRRITHRGLDLCVEAGEITPDSLVNEICAQGRAYLASPKQPLTLVTSISGDLPRGTTIRRRLGRATVVWTRRLPAKFHGARDGLLSYGGIPFDTRSGWPNDYGNALYVTVQERTAVAAQDLALDALDVLRGIWNLALSYSSLPGGARSLDDALNRLRVGPIFTVHDASGRAVEPGYSYDPHWKEAPDRPYAMSGPWKTFLKNERYLRGLVGRVAYEAKARGFLVRHCRALDSFDPHRAFLDLWSLLEELTGTGPRDGYAATVDRTLFAASRWDFDREILHNLHLYRNASVHEAETDADGEVHLLQLKRFVDDVLLFHLRRRFRRVSEATEFMAQPRDPSDLSSKEERLRQDLRLVRAAMRWRAPAKRT